MSTLFHWWLIAMAIFLPVKLWLFLSERRETRDAARNAAKSAKASAKAKATAEGKAREAVTYAAPPIPQPHSAPPKGAQPPLHKLTEDLIQSRTLAAKQAETIKKMRTEDERKATLMGVQEREIGRLMELGHQQAALIQTLQTAAQGGATTREDDRRFSQLRALILRELHPDHAPAGSVDSVLRAEVFKLLWPKIETIRDGG